MVKYLLDSDIAIAILRDKKDSTGLRQKVLSVRIDNCFMSEIATKEHPQIYSEARKHFLNRLGNLSTTWTC